MTSLALTLHRDLETGEWFVERVEAQKDNIRTQTKFCVPYPISTAFNPEFVAYLLKVLPETSAPSALVFDQQDVLALAIGFSKLRVIAQRALAGLQSVTVRVNDVVGTISNIFSPALLLDAPAYGRSEKMTPNHKQLQPARKRAPLWHHNQ